MRLRIHHAIFAGFLGVVGLLVVLVVVLVGTGLRRELVELMRDQLEREVLLAAELVRARPDAQPDDLADLISDRIGFRVTLIGPDGSVLGDSDVPDARLSVLEDHGDRPEVVGARASEGVAFADRTSLTVREPLLYAAFAVERAGGPLTVRVAAPLSEIEETVARSQRAVAATGLLSTLFALIVAYGLSILLARPLVTLADRAALLAAGEFGRRAPRNSGVAELDELSMAFNRLTDELQARLAELGRERDEMQALIDTMAEGVIALTDDARVLRTNRTARDLLRLPEPVTFAPVGSIVRHPALRDLLEESVVAPSQAHEVVLEDRHLIVASRMLEQGGAVTTLLDVTEIRRLEQVRRDFVANASHELKTPLTSIRGFAETLLEDEPPPDLGRRFLTAIRDNTLRLQRLVDDLLDLSRLESGGWVAHPEPLDVAEIAREVWRDFAERAAAEDIAFGVEGTATAMADEAGLMQIYRNLFDNALRHTPAGGDVLVRIDRVAGGVEVAVSDTGAGIPSRALPRIFERFYRADAARARGAGGTGLGLAIVRHLAEAMGGEVGAESELGRGTTVLLRLPSGVAGEGLDAAGDAPSSTASVTGP